MDPVWEQDTQSCLVHEQFVPVAESGQVRWVQFTVTPMKDVPQVAAPVGAYEHVFENCDATFWHSE